MNNTPRTDAAAWPETDVVEGNFARQLETELNEAREQLKKTRKHLKDANRGAEINAHALRINADKLAAVTKERDEALKDLEFRRDLYTLQTKQLNDVREQRDRLAEALRNAERTCADD